MALFERHKNTNSEIPTDPIAAWFQCAACGVPFTKYHPNDIEVFAIDRLRRLKNGDISGRLEIRCNCCKSINVFTGTGQKIMGLYLIFCKPGDAGSNAVSC